MPRDATFKAGLVACTIAAKPLLSAARVLARSFTAHHPAIPFVVLLADEVDGVFDPGDEPFDLLRFADLAVPDAEQFRFRYSQQPLSYAATPYLMTHLLTRGYSRVVFFKQETLVLGDLSAFFDRLERASMVLTPHLVSPLTGADRVARDLNILQSGTYNAGMVGVRATPATAQFLAWWQRRMATHCRHDVRAGMHFEQRWLDLAPAFLDDVAVLRDPAFNVAHWNLPERHVTVDDDDDTVRVDGDPCRVFRFSGYSMEAPAELTRYNHRLTPATLGVAWRVFERYRDALLAAGYNDTCQWPYAFATFDNGVPVPDIARRLYLEMGSEVARFGDPLQTAHEGSYWHWLVGAADGRSTTQPPVTRLWHAVHRQRPDLQQAFPAPFDADRMPFMDWALHTGKHELQISERLLPHCTG